MATQNSSLVVSVSARIMQWTGLCPLLTARHLECVEGFFGGRGGVTFGQWTNRAELADGIAVHVRCPGQVICSVSSTNLLSVAEHVACTWLSARKFHWSRTNKWPYMDVKCRLYVGQYRIKINRFNLCPVAPNYDYLTFWRRNYFFNFSTLCI